MPDIILLRAIAAGANSLRYNPEIDPNDAAIFEAKLVELRDTICGQTDVGTN